MRHLTVIPVLYLASLLGCAPAYVPPPPVPPTPAEQVPRPPASPISLIWRPGHYDWTGVGYVWVAGEWVDRAGHGTLWQDGYWQRTGVTSVWVPAHWI